jgi:hypothetical protein
MTARPGITIVTFTDDRTAEICLDHLASAEHVFDAMDLARLMLKHGITAVKIIRTQTARKPATAVWNLTGDGRSNLKHTEANNGQRS